MKRKSLGYGYFILVGVLFLLCCLTGQRLAAEGNIEWSGAWLAKTAALGLVLGGGGGAGICFVCYALLEKQNRGGTKGTGAENTGTAERGEREAGQRGAVRLVFLRNLAVIFLCWLPCYLAYYPAICSYDATIQTGQIVEHAYTDHHPIAHTLLIAGSMRLGGLLGNVTAGVGIYGLLQMIFLAACFAYGIARLKALGIKRGWRIALLLYAGLYPFHMYMSVTMIKDTVFSGFFLVFLVTLAEVLAEGKAAAGGRRLWVLSVSAAGMVLFRNNGKYALLVLLGFLLLCVLFGKKSRGEFGKILLVCGAGFVCGNLLLSALFRLTGAVQGDRREMLSMPIQQLSRTYVYHGGIEALNYDAKGAADDSLSQDARDFLNELFVDEGYRYYRPDIADPVKNRTNTGAVRYQPVRFAKVYLSLLGRYPGDFVNAALALNAGYLYPGDESHGRINYNGRDRGLGYVQTRWVEAELNPRGIYKASLWPWLHERLEDWADRNGYLGWPLVKYLFVPGTYLWLYLLLFGVLWLKGNVRMCLPLGLVGGYYGTLFLGPAVQLRYLYPVMIALPFLALICGRGVRSREQA